MSCRVEWDLEHGGSLWAGIDEAGRGSWAGPVSCACVVLDPKTISDPFFSNVNDSKKLTRKRREALYEEIMDRALMYQIVSVSHKVVDEVNVLRATMRGMRTALLECCKEVEGVENVFVDGNQLFDPPDFDINIHPLVKGDSISCSVSCASILAKVWRDRYMASMEEKYPGFSWGAHFGYGTPQHQKELAEHGICEIHRMSYGPIKALIKE